MMIKRPIDIVNATLDWKAFADQSEDGTTERSIEEFQIINSCLPFFHSNDGAKSRSCVLEDKCTISKDIQVEGGSTVINKNRMDTEQPRAGVNDNMELHENTDRCQSKVKLFH